jgi:membrane protein implicated in regulation of membrane protease activity
MSRRTSARRVSQIVAALIIGGALAVVLVAGKGPFLVRIGIVCVWVILVVLAPWTARKLGLPKQKVSEAYITSLRRWRRTRGI